jgi:Protein of unknown function (DUF3429)
MSSRPILPYVLGISGLVPFVGLAIAIPFASASIVHIGSLFLMGYGAAILSFLGGARWGSEISLHPDSPSPTVICLAMLPPLAGWFAVSLFALALLTEAFAVLAIGLALQLYWDTKAIKIGTYPDWYRPLRILLSVIAIFSLLSAAVFYPHSLFAGIG